MSPSAIDAEVQLLSSDQDFLDHQMFLRMVIYQMQTNRDFELMQSYLRLYLKYHTDVCMANPSVLELIKEMKSLQQERSQRLLKLLHSNLCMIQYVSKFQ
jgi:U3 small nucleolar RNA-associated protein 21